MNRTILRGGRVIDPAAAHRDDRRCRGATADRVTSVSPTPILDADATVVDVTGLVVGPGFVDLHSHVHSIAGQRLQAFDGVTTNLDLEAGLMPIERAYAEAAAAGRVLNYGFSASWTQARGQVLAGCRAHGELRRRAALLGDVDWQRTLVAAPSSRPGWGCSRGSSRPARSASAC